jgi:hypothetical protein
MDVEKQTRNGKKVDEEIWVQSKKIIMGKK